MEFHIPRMGQNQELECKNEDTATVSHSARLHTFTTGSYNLKIKPAVIRGRKFLPKTSQSGTGFRTRPL